MKRIILLIVFGFLIENNIYAQACESFFAIKNGDLNLCNDNPWVLIFEDNFEGNSLDLSKWTPIEGVNRDGNKKNESSWKKPQNVVVENGELKIYTKREYVPPTTYELWEDDSSRLYTNSFEFTTGEIWTKSKFNFGKIEAMVKIPKGKGLWSAFWTFDASPWNEIDIFEFFGNNFSTYSPTLHDASVNVHKSCSGEVSGPDFSLAFHKYTVTWEPNEICFYIDDVFYWHQHRATSLPLLPLLNVIPVDCQLKSGYPYLFNEIYPKNAMKIIFDVVTMAKEDKAPDSTTPFPSIMEVDWVRYYSREESCTDVNANNGHIIDPILYNYIAGKNISIGNTTINSGLQLKLVADNSVTITSNFTVQLGATFEIKIDPSICTE